jgi:chorismate mutase
MAITTLRSDLIALTEQIITLISQRKEVVTKIQNVKSKNALKAFIPEREKEVYLQLSDQLEKFSDKELLSLSLLIEEHAGDHYPAWSESVHLRQKTNTLHDLINPVMLLILRPSSFKMLTLKKEYQEQIQ